MTKWWLWYNDDSTEEDRRDVDTADFSGEAEFSDPDLIIHNEVCWRMESAWGSDGSREGEVTLLVETDGERTYYTYSAETEVRIAFVPLGSPKEKR